MSQMKLILASGSPRRRELLSQAGFAFDVRVSNADEDAPADMPPVEVAKHNALVKALAVAQDAEEENCLVVGADTIVVLGERIYGKPADADRARKTLGELSGRTHQVITGVALVNKDAFFSFAESTDVVFKQLEPETIETYIQTGDPFDKAGAYGIQSKGGHLVERIEGDYDNVVGLPVARLACMLGKLGIEPMEGGKAGG